MAKRGLQLSVKEAGRLVKMLGEYQALLESTIECHSLQDGSTMPNDPDAAAIVAEVRRDWMRAEQWIKRLSGDKYTLCTPPVISKADAVSCGGSHAE